MADDKNLDLDIKGLIDIDAEPRIKSEGDMILDIFNPQVREGLKDEKLAGQTMVMQGQDKDPSSYSTTLQDPNKKETFTAEVEGRINAVEDNARQYLQDTLNSDPEAFEAATKAVQERVEENRGRQDDPLRAEKEVVASIVERAPISLSKEIRDQEAARLAVLNTAAELLDKQGLRDTFADFAGYLVPFGVTIDQNDLLNNKFDWTNATDIERFVFDYQSLPAERKIAELPAITEAILEATGTTGVSDKNVLKAVSILLSLVSARGPQEQGFERNLDVLFGILDAGGLLASAVKGVHGAAMQRVIKKNNMIKKINELGDTPRAANIDIQALGNEDAAKLAGVNRQEAYNNAIPVERTSVDPAWTPGMAPEVSKQLNELNRAADKLVNSFLDDSILIKEGLLREPEKRAVIQETVAKLKGDGKKSDVLNEGIHIDNIKVTSIDETGFTLSYTMKKEGQQDLKVNQGVKWIRDQATGKFVETTEKAATRPGSEYGLSKAAWSYTGDGGDFLASFKSASNLSDLVAAAQSKTLDLLKEANKTRSGFLTPGARKRVNAVEIAGDEYIDPVSGTRGKTFSPSELIAGINTQGGTIRLTSHAEQEAYYKHRIFADTMFQLENHAARRQLEILGFTKHIKVSGGQDVIGRIFKNVNDAKSSIRGKSGIHVWDDTLGDSVPLTDEFLDDLYSKGQTLVRSLDDTPIQRLDGVVEHFDYVAIGKADVKPLPRKVLHYKDGYVPKINKGVEYLVKEKVPALKRGAEKFTRATTLRFFASKKDADAFRASMIEDFLRKNPKATLEEAEERFLRLADREMTPMQKLQESTGSSGGLFTGSRSSHDIATGLAGVKTERLSPLEAFQRNAQHIGSLMTRNEWRLGEEQRWLNTIDHYGFKNEGFTGTRLGNSAVERALETERKFIQAWNGVPTGDESFFEGVMQNLHDWVLTQERRLPGLKDRTSASWTLAIKNLDPAVAVKTVVMHTVMGMLVPAQLFVQGAAATVALSRFPLLAPKGLGYAFKMMLADRLKPNKFMKAMPKKLSDADTPLFEEMYEAFGRSGLSESIRRNADLAAVDSYGVMSLNSMKRLGETSLFFWRTGEMFNRRVSFAMSFLNWKRLNPGKLADNEALKAIKADANLSMLELNNANTAFWQGGPGTGTFRNILGVMTQFQQVAAKSTELLIKGPNRGGFTIGEKLKILLAQFGLWGSVAVPLGPAIVGGAVDALGVKMTPEEREAWNQGVVGALIVNAIGSEIEVAPRLAPFGQLTQTVRDLLFDDIPFVEMMLGVAGSVRGRFGDSFSKLYYMQTSEFNRDEVRWKDLLLGASVLGEIPSSGRGILKAYIMHNMHKILDRHGNIVDNQDYSLETEFGTALGFRPIAEVDIRQTQLANLDDNEVVQEATDEALSLYWRYMEDSKTDPQAGPRLKAALNVLFASIGDPLLTQRVRNSMERKIMAEGTLRDRELKKFLDSLATDMLEGATVLRDSFWKNATNTRAVVQPFENGEEE